MDTEDMDGYEICNVIATFRNICLHYKETFYPLIKDVVTGPPTVLRCGIARGSVFSVGNGEDYVGPCINIVSRLQKIGGLTFCVSRRGFDVKKYMEGKSQKELVVKSVSLPGIGENELVLILKHEFDSLNTDEKKLFKNP